MTRIEREKKTVGQMVALYCRAKHPHTEGLCPDCQALLEYAYARLDRCKFGEQKTSCQKCPIHCYKPALRQQMRQVMRYAGPRMLWHHPLTAIRHMMG